MLSSHLFVFHASKLCKLQDCIKDLHFQRSMRCTHCGRAHQWSKWYFKQKVFPIVWRIGPLEILISLTLLR